MLTGNKLPFRTCKPNAMDQIHYIAFHALEI